MKPLKCGIQICFRYGLGPSLLKLMVEIISGIWMPLMVLVVTAFLNSAVSFIGGDGAFSPMVTSLCLMAAYYAYSQMSPIIDRLSNRALEHALFENLRPKLIEKHARVSFPLLEDAKTLDLITRVCGNAEKNMMALLGIGIGVLRLGIQVAGTLTLLAAHIWWMIPLFAVSALPIWLIARKGGKAIYASDVITTMLTRRHYYLSGVLTGREAAAERTLFGYGDEINKQFSAAHLKRSNMVTKEIAVEEITVNACGLILNGLVLVAVFALLPKVEAGTVTVGLYISLIGALVGLARMITGTLSRFITDATGLGEYMRDYTRFFALPEFEGAEEGGDKPLSFQSLVIKNLRFRYTADGEDVLKGLSLTMEPGKCYSLIGRNGAGKSTLVKILLGLYRDFEGEIRINGIDIARYSGAELRRIFSIVYQDFAKYDISLEDNITLGRTGGDLHQITALSGLGPVVSGLPLKEKTPLGRIYENGADISGGEWQRVAIARALYASAPFMILDEPTASLSPMMESELYGRFAEMTRGKTSLLISHRLGATKLSDALFVLEDGGIAETGTHEALMAAKGIYADMFESQRSWYDA